MTSRFDRGFASLLYAERPTVAKIHGFCIASGTDIALFCDQIVAAADARSATQRHVCGVCQAAGISTHRLGDQRAKRMLLAGDNRRRTGRAIRLVIEAPPAGPARRAGQGVGGRIAGIPVNQLMMIGSRSTPRCSTRASPPRRW